MGEVVNGNFDSPEARNAHFVKAINDFRDDIFNSVDMFLEREQGADETFAWLFVYTGAIENLHKLGLTVDYLREFLQTVDEESPQKH